MNEARSLTAVCAAVLLSTVWSTAGLAKPDEVDGINVPFGRIPQRIENGRYPRTYYPNTEKVAADECFFTPEQWMKIAGFPYEQAYWVTSQSIHRPKGFGKLMSMVEPRMAVAYHYWNHRDAAGLPGRG